MGRTAGTSFYQFMEHALGMEYCLPISAFAWGQRQGRISPNEYICALDPPLFTYGHYVHESWIEYLRSSGPVLTFSFFRDPWERRVSLSRHLAALDAATAGSNVRLHLDQLDMWCAEVLRCFPTAREVFADEPVWRQAFIALSSLDHLLPMSDVTGFAHRLVKMLGNVANIVEFPSLNASTAMVAEHEAPGEDDQDGQLFNAIASGHRALESETTALRHAIRAKYSHAASAVDAFKRHLSVYMKAEFESMAARDQNVKLLISRRAAIDDLLRSLGAG